MPHKTEFTLRYFHTMHDSVGVTLGIKLILAWPSISFISEIDHDDGVKKVAKGYKPNAAIMKM